MKNEGKPKENHCRPENCKRCYYHRKRPVIVAGQKVYCALLA